MLFVHATMALPLPWMTRHSVLAASPSRDEMGALALRTERQDVTVHEDKKKLRLKRKWGEGMRNSQV